MSLLASAVRLRTQPHGETEDCAVLVDAALGCGSVEDAVGGLNEAARGIGSVGTVFRLRPDSNGTWVEKELHSFSEKGEDGFNPFAGLILDGKRNLYSTTFAGGAYNSGTVFEITP